MKSKFLTCLSTTLLLGVCLSVTEITNQQFCQFEKEKVIHKVTLLETSPDVLNPIYILK